MPQLPKSNVTLQKEGKWVTYAPGIRLRICSMRRPEFREAVRRALKPKGRRMRADADLDRDEALKEPAAQFLLVDWEEIEDEDGSPIPYSPQQALTWFRDEAYADLYEFVIEVAADGEEYRQSLMEEARGN